MTYMIEITREAGESPMGHQFPAERRIMKDIDGEILELDTREEAERLARFYQDHQTGFTRKTYRVMEVDPPDDWDCSPVGPWF
jgi:hypothetical protein